MFSLLSFNVCRETFSVKQASSFLEARGPAEGSCELLSNTTEEELKEKEISLDAKVSSEQDHLEANVSSDANRKL